MDTSRYLSTAGSRKRTVFWLLVTLPDYDTIVGEDDGDFPSPAPVDRLPAHGIRHDRVERLLRHSYEVGVVESADAPCTAPSDVQKR